MKDLLLKVLLVGCILGMLYILAGVAIVAYKRDFKSPIPPSHKYSSIVRLVEDGKTFCTGTVISKTLILTATHCVVVHDAPFLIMQPKIIIRPVSNKPVNVVAKPFYINPRMDQALMSGDFSAFEVRPVITDPNVLSGLVKQKTVFISCGYPFNGDLFCTTTVFSAVQDFFWALDGTLLPGMSGGPTMLADGTVVAVNIAVDKDKSIVTPLYNLFKSVVGKK